MTESVIGDLLNEATAKRRTQEPLTQFITTLEDNFSTFLRRAVAESSSPQSEARKGLGVLPSPAKKVIVKRALQHESTNADLLRVGYTSTGEDKRKRDLETAVIHVVQFTSPEKHIYATDTDYYTATLDWLASVVGERDLVFPQEEGPAIQVGKVNAVVHYVDENAFGQFALHTVPIKTPEDIERARVLEEESPSRLLTMQYGKEATTSNIGYTILEEQIMEQISTHAPQTLNIPLILSIPFTNSLVRAKKPFMTGMEQRVNKKI